MAIVINGSGTVTGLAVGGLPDGTVDAGTLATDSVTAAKLEVSAITHSDLPAGSVLQVVQSIQTTYVNTTSTSFGDTGLAATITPKFSSSKIMVVINAHGLAQNGGGAKAELALHRGSILAYYLRPIFVGSGATFATGSCAINYLDSPNNTSANVYKLQIRNRGSSDSVRFNDFHTGSERSSSSITLMEIAG